jgi:hypothetical protein
MKHGLPESNNEKSPEQSLDERFATRPDLRRRLLGIANLIDQAVDEGCTADEAEARAIEEVRKLGKEVMSDWAEKSQADAVAKAQANNSKLRPYRKKNS